MESTENTEHHHRLLVLLQLLKRIIATQLPDGATQSAQLRSLKIGVVCVALIDKTSLGQ